MACPTALRRDGKLPLPGKVTEIILPGVLPWGVALCQWHGSLTACTNQHTSPQTSWLPPPTTGKGQTVLLGSLILKLCSKMGKETGWV